MYKYYNLRFIILMFISLSGCSTLPMDYPRTPSTAYHAPEATKIASIFKQEQANHQGKSGCILVTDGERAFVARKAMIDIAEHTLDLQYYIWKADDTGKILIYALLQAADRGVRVRLLLDDIGTLSLKDINIALLATHPNIEVRLYNPFTSRSLKGLQLLFNLDRLNHRMHNKAMILDNAMAIVGGRNIADNYFDVHTKANFRDLDVATVGPVVQEISASFDNFWNSEWSVPIEALHKQPAPEQFTSTRNKLRDWYASLHDFPYPIDKNADNFRQRLDELKTDFIWADAEVLGDEPDKPDTKKETEIIRVIRQLSEELEHELLIEISYFIPTNRGVDNLAALHKRGVNIRVLTNSLAGNDVIAAHAGYARYREGLLDAGVKLFEFRPDAGNHKKNNNKVFRARSAKSNLHTKALVFDRKSVIIGAMNLDPRSFYLNTEIVLHIQSKVLAEQVTDYMDNGVLPENSYRLELKDAEWSEENDFIAREIAWITEEGGQPVTYNSDPRSGFFRKLAALFLSLLPIEHHL